MTKTQIEALEWQIQTNEYFNLLGGILNLLRNNLIEDKFDKAGWIDILRWKNEELAYLQEKCRIAKN
jgi:hypothetical protein